jgi:hypothetical protein
LKNGKFFTVESSQKASFSQILPLLRHRVAVPGKKKIFRNVSEALLLELSLNLRLLARKSLEKW